MGQWYFIFDPRSSIFHHCNALSVSSFWRYPRPDHFLGEGSIKPQSRKLSVKGGEIFPKSLCGQCPIRDYMNCNVPLHTSAGHFLIFSQLSKQIGGCQSCQTHVLSSFDNEHIWCPFISLFTLPFEIMYHTLKKSSSISWYIGLSQRLLPSDEQILSGKQIVEVNLNRICGRKGSLKF